MSPLEIILDYFKVSCSTVRHRGGSFFCGALFASAWLIFIDAAIVGNTWDGYKAPPWYWYFPGFISVIALVLMNLVSLSDMSPYGLFWDPEVSKKIRAWLFIAFAISFVPILAAIGIMAGAYGDQGSKVWPGVAIILQTILIFVSSCGFLIARKVDADEDYDYIG